MANCMHGLNPIKADTKDHSTDKPDFLCLFLGPPSFLSLQYSSVVVGHPRDLQVSHSVISVEFSSLLIGFIKVKHSLN